MTSTLSNRSARPFGAAVSDGEYVWSVRFEKSVESGDHVKALDVLRSAESVGVYPNARWLLRAVGLLPTAQAVHFTDYFANDMEDVLLTALHSARIHNTTSFSHDSVVEYARYSLPLFVALAMDLALPDEAARCQSLAQMPAWFAEMGIPELKASNGTTPLCASAQSGCFPVFTLLLDASLSACGSLTLPVSGWTVLHSVCAVPAWVNMGTPQWLSQERCAMYAVEKLTTSFCTADGGCTPRRSPILLAASSGFESVLRVMAERCERDASIGRRGWLDALTATSDDNIGILALACFSGCGPSMVAWLLDQREWSDVDLLIALTAACYAEGPSDVVTREVITVLAAAFKTQCPLASPGYRYRYRVVPV